MRTLIECPRPHLAFAESPPVDKLIARDVSVFSKYWLPAGTLL